MTRAERDPVSEFRDLDALLAERTPPAEPTAGTDEATSGGAGATAGSEAVGGVDPAVHPDPAGLDPESAPLVPPELDARRRLRRGRFESWWRSGREAGSPVEPTPEPPVTDRDTIEASHPDGLANERSIDGRAADGAGVDAAMDGEGRHGDRGGGHDHELGELRSIAVGSIVPNRLQPRRYFEQEALEALTESVRELGVLQPVLVRPLGAGGFELIAGERRWRASQRVGLTTIPAVVRHADDQASLERAIVENLHRQDLSPLEEAAAYQELVDEFGLTQEAVATRVGKSRSAVANTLRLLQLPGSVQRLVADGLVSAGHARALLSLGRRHDQERLARRIVAEEWSVRRTEEAVRSAATNRPEREADGRTSATGERRARAPSASELEVQALLEDGLETQVEVQRSVGGGGKLVIRFADDDDLDRLARAMVEGWPDDV